MADDDEDERIMRREIADRMFDKKVSDALARQIDHANPLPTEDRIRQIAADEAQKSLKALLNTDEVTRLSRLETLRILRTISLNASDDKAEETGHRVRLALQFPTSAWSFIKWAGGAFGAAVLASIAGLLMAIVGRTR